MSEPEQSLQVSDGTAPAGKTAAATARPDEEGPFTEESLAFIQGLLRIEAHWDGPMPPPAALAAFEQIHPGLADRITAMAEKEQDHRHGIQRRSLNIEGLRTVGGMVSALIITLTSLASSAFLIHDGHTWPGTLLGGGTLGTVVTLFLKTDGVKRREPSAQDKAKKRR